jgi:hypothetical protein
LASCTSPAEYTGLALGDHIFEVVAVDRAGNVDGSAALRRWTIAPEADTTAPETTIDSGPSGTTTSPSATFAFSASESGSTFACSLDGAPSAPCSSPVTFTGLPDGNRSFEVTATDPAGNADSSPAVRGWTIDTTPPETRIDAGPSGPTNSTTATFEFSADGAATFACALDAGSFTACTSPWTYTGLAAGGHTFRVRGTDGAGNVDQSPATRAWTVDTTSPQTTINTGPSGTVTSPTATFTFSANESGSTFQCQLDTAPFAACTSPTTYSGLIAGSHTFRVRATDPAGNTDASPATRTWTVQGDTGCTTTTLTANADAWIEQNSPSNNKGDDSTLKVRTKGPADNARAFVRFGLPAAPEGCVLASASLRLYSDSAKDGRTLEALRVSGTWTEGGVTWTNQPGTTGAAASTTSGLGYRTWDVGAQVQAMLDAGINDGFLIRDALENQDSEQSLHSREKGSNLPQLVVAWAVVPAAGGFVGSPTTLDLSALEPTMRASIAAILAVFSITVSSSYLGRRPLRAGRVRARMRGGSATI